MTNTHTNTETMDFPDHTKTYKELIRNDVLFSKPLWCFEIVNDEIRCLLYSRTVGEWTLVEKDIVSLMTFDIGKLRRESRRKRKRNEFWHIYWSWRWKMMRWKPFNGLFLVSLTSKRWKSSPRVVFVQNKLKCSSFCN